MDTLCFSNGPISLMENGDVGYHVEIFYSNDFSLDNKWILISVPVKKNVLK